MDKVIYEVEVTPKTAEQLKQLTLNSEFWGEAINEVDIIKGALWEFLQNLTTADNYSTIIGINTETKHKNYQLKNRFKEIMKSKGMKQVDLIKLTDINKTNLSQVLNNKYTPGIDTFFRIWAALECPVLSECIYIEYID